MRSPLIVFDIFLCLFVFELKTVGLYLSKVWNLFVCLLLDQLYPPLLSFEDLPLI